MSITDAKIIKEQLNSIYGTGCFKDEFKDDGKIIEKWIWVDGYKGTRRDLSCDGNGHHRYEFEIGKQHDMPDGAEIRTCDSGFHFCLKLENVFNHYDIGAGNRFFKVSALVRERDYEKCLKRTNKHSSFSVFNEDKLAAKSIIFTKELSVEEIFEAYKEVSTTCNNWTMEQKKQAIEVGVRTVEEEISILELVDLGYAKEMACYIVGILDKRGLATCLAKQPGLSMDTKIDILFRDSGRVRGSNSVVDMYSHLFATPANIESSMITDAIAKVGLTTTYGELK